MKKPSFLILLVFIAFQVSAQTNDTISIPFLEDWNTGSFETNYWITETLNWKINNDEGNPEPSAEFNSVPPIEGDSYSFTLTSASFNADSILAGNIFLDFDMKSDINSPTETENFTVKVFNGTSWNTVYERSNTESFEWEKIHLDVSFFTLGQIFKVRFEANGENIANIENWMIDNINIYRTCPSAHDLTVEEYIHSQNHFLLFNWQNDSVAPPQNGWKYWGNGNNHNATGASEADIYAAARWESNSFPELQGLYITKVRVFAYDEGFTSWVIKIWTGENAGTLIYYEDVSNQINVGFWTEIVLSTPVPYDVTKEIWVGYTTHILSNYFPLGLDSGPGVTGYGDKISMDGLQWENLSDYGLSYNWNIHFFVGDSSGRNQWVDNNDKYNQNSIYGINLYQSVNGGEFEFVYSFPYSNKQLLIPKPSGPENDLYCYKLTHFYNRNSDSCESAPFTTADPNIDYVCYLLTGTDEEKAVVDNSIKLFPNPATSQLNVESETEMQEISLVNAFGQVVLRKQNSGNKAEINTSGMQAGVYFVKIKTEQGTANQRVVVSK